MLLSESRVAAGAYGHMNDTSTSDYETCWSSSKPTSSPDTSTLSSLAGARSSYDMASLLTSSPMPPGLTHFTAITGSPSATMLANLPTPPPYRNPPPYFPPSMDWSDFLLTSPQTNFYIGNQSLGPQVVPQNSHFLGSGGFHSPIYQNCPQVVPSVSPLVGDQSRSSPLGDECASPLGDDYRSSPNNLNRDKEQDVSQDSSFTLKQVNIYLEFY